MPVHIRHAATCPEVDPQTCAVTDIPEHMHDQRIAWFRLDPTLHVGLGDGWQVSAQVPVDLRAVTVAYETMDGAPYDPPYADIHHRQEVVAGPVDSVILLRRYASSRHRVLGGAIGTSLPIGKTEEDPFRLASEGRTHQHLQLGTGSFVPVLAVDLVVSGPRWGVAVWGMGRTPLYANAKGYRPPFTATLGGGPSYRLTPDLQLLASAEATAESAERWHDVAHGGRFSTLAGVGALYTLSPTVVLQTQVRGTVWQWTAKAADEDATYVQPVIGTVGVSWSFGGPNPVEDTPSE